MGKPILYRWFKLGKLPKNVAQNKLSLFDEGIKIVASYKNFKSPGKNFKRKKTVFLGSIMCSNKRIVAFAYSKPLLNLELSDKRLKKVDFSASTDKIVCMKFNASEFGEETSGDVIYQFYTDKAQEFLKKIK